MAHNAKIERSKELAHLIFPLIEDMETVYDAQTVLTSVAGFIQYDLVQKEAALKVHDIKFDYSHEPDSEVKKRVLKLVDLLQTEDAKSTSTLLQTISDKLGQHLAAVHLKGPMSQIKAEDFIA